MRRLTVATVSVAASLALAACAERETTSPRAISSDGASFAGRGGASCSFSGVGSAAQAYFTSNQDPVFDMIKVMKDAFNTNNGGNVAATPEGWVILSRVADKRLTDSTGGGAAGAAFVVAVANCMADLAANTSPLTLPASLTANSNALLARVLNSGIWEIRNGGSTVGGPAAGKNKAGTTPVRSLGSPIWGVERATASTPWPGTVSYAIVGYPIHDPNPLLTNAQQIDQSDALQATYEAETPSPWPFNAFDLQTLPTTAVTDHSTLRVGICVPHIATANDGSVYYLVHNDSELLPNSVPGALCDLSVANGLTGPWYTRLALGAARFFKPGVLFAQDDSRDFIGGLPSGWSPQGAGQLNASNVTLTITTQPKNNVRDSTDNSLVVTATITGSTTPVPGVTITGLTVLNNQGAPAGAVIVENSTNLPQTTDHDGHATVHFQIGKPGAYYIVVTSNLDGGALNTPTSVKFNVKN